MPDIIAAANKALDLVKSLRELHKAVSETEAKMMLAELTTELSEVKLGAADLREQLVDLRAQNALLREELARKSASTPEIDEGAYIFPDASSHYCIACFEGKGGKRIPMTITTGPFKVFGKWNCPSCNHHAG